MPLLEAFLALALTLLSLAMIATLIVEMMSRLAGARAENLKTMLGEYYDRELKAIVEAELKKSGETLEAHKKAFIQKLIANPLMKKREIGSLTKARRTSLVWVSDFLRLKCVTHRGSLASLSTADLFKKLACTDIGKRIKAKTEVEIDEAVDSLSRSYNEICGAATDLFKRRTQVISLWMGVLVAFCLNANALFLFQSYLDNPKARAMAVAKADAALESFTGNTERPQGFQTRQELEDHVNSIKDEIEALGDMGLPVGYTMDRMPLSGPKNSTFPRWLDILFWAIGVLVTGLLIGLGGPFWFNVVRKLTDTLQVLRGNTPNVADPDASPGTPADPIKVHRDTFKLTGGLPPLMKAQKNVNAAIEAASQADKDVKAAAQTLAEIREAAGNQPSEPMIAAVAHAEETLNMAIDAQKKLHERKMAAEACAAHAV